MMNIIVEVPRIGRPTIRLFSHIFCHNAYSRLCESGRRGMASFVVALGLRWRSSFFSVFSWMFLFGSKRKQKWTSNGHLCDPSSFFSF